MDAILKYPRTAHLEGSCLQKGDEDLNRVPYADLAGRYIVVEEKLDGANCGIRFDGQANLLLQSRGHYLTGGGRERHFNLLKSWAAAHEERLFDIFGERYLCYGEWLHAKHTVFYDRLPHYFLEFDLFDTQEGTFLSTAAREELLEDSPLVSVPVLYRGIAPRHLEELLELLRPSLGKSPAWRDTLAQLALRQGLGLERTRRETDGSDFAEGLYIKIESGFETVGRLKWVRSGFLQIMLDNESHWLSRPIVPNQLTPGADLFGPVPTGWSVSDWHTNGGG